MMKAIPSSTLNGEKKMINYPYLTLASDGETISLRVSQLKPYIDRIKLPKDMFVELTFREGEVINGRTSDTGFLITFIDWPESLSPRPAPGTIFQIQVSRIKYWREYQLAQSL